ncbi:hypothetical protein [Dickeya chrysanthemi]|uniref:hypothetical protein n=1 Tax=Dickeya chrysanthemi TaxID=556 RepID=UPI000532C15F|nr:hypothetical protein [Dickeya chrysanthemi]
MGQSVVLEPVPAGWRCQCSGTDAASAGFVMSGMSAARYAYLGYSDIARSSTSRYLKHQTMTVSSAVHSWLMATVDKGGLRHDN